MKNLEQVDRDVFDAIIDETHRQGEGLELIASENYSSLAVQSAMANLLTDKYAEGHPFHRFYAGCDNVDNIEDYAHNVTRFFVVGTHPSEPSGADKTAVLCSVKDKVGALHDLLAAFKDCAINMSKIESFPSPSAAWQYYFFIDFLGHPREEDTRRALEQMERECLMLKVLGAFPRSDG